MDLDEAITEIIKQIPSLGCLAWLVVYFLKHMRETVATFREGENEKKAVLQEIIDKNADAFDRMTEALGKNSYLLDKHYSNGRVVNN